MFEFLLIASTQADLKTGGKPATKAHQTTFLHNVLRQSSIKECLQQHDVQKKNADIAT